MRNSPLRATFLTPWAAVLPVAASLIVAGCSRPPANGGPHTPVAGTAGPDAFRLGPGVGPRAWIEADVARPDNAVWRLYLAGAGRESERPAPDAARGGASGEALFIERAPGGRYMLASSNSIHAGVKPENFAAMLQAGRDYGSYDA